MHEVEGRAAAVCFVDGVGEDYAVGASGGRPGEGDAKLEDENHLVETLKVAIVRLQADGTEGVSRLMESGGGVCEFGHDAEWGGERVGSPLVFFLIPDSDLA